MVSMRNALTRSRDRLRRTATGRALLKVVVGAAGAVFVLLGVALVALPGPLTIPPILLGVYLWSTEFRWAERLLDRVRDAATDAWHSAKDKPVRSALVAGLGLLAAVAGTVYLATVGLPF